VRLRRGVDWQKELFNKVNPKKDAAQGGKRYPEQSGKLKKKQMKGLKKMFRERRGRKNIRHGR